MQVALNSESDYIQTLLGSAKFESTGAPVQGCPYFLTGGDFLTRSNEPPPPLPNRGFPRVQVALNSESDYNGGRLVFATQEGLVWPSRSGCGPWGLGYSVQQSCDPNLSTV